MNCETTSQSMDGCTLYILRCADGPYYTGLTRRSVDERLSEHQNGCSTFTSSRLPVTVAHAEHYPVITDAIAAERRIKGWTRAKKEAYMRGDFPCCAYWRNGASGKGRADRCVRGSRRACRRSSP